jgi:hypothetical protein
VSSEALAWAFKQPIKSSGVKFTLIALCECANYKTGRITPSIAHICEITSQNRKSVIAHIKQLEADGYITDTGERTGATKQVKVYSAAIGTVPETEPFQNRNSTKTGAKQSQKRDTEPSLEPSPSEANASSGKRARSDFPKIDCASAALWRDFLTNRKAKRTPNTPAAHAKVVRDLDRWALETGWPPGEVFRACVEAGWAGIYDPRTTENGRISGHQPAVRQAASLRGSRPNPAYDMWREAQADLAAEAARRDPQPDFGAWPALPSGE